MSAGKRPDEKDAPAGSALLGRTARLAGGYALLGVGGALLVLPGPGIPVVLGGLALLAPEVPWAGRVHDLILDRFRELRRHVGGGRTRTRVRDP